MTETPLTAMTPEREQEIRARLADEHLMPGPWACDGAEIYRAPYGEADTEQWVGETLDVDNDARTAANAAFIATARDAVPKLLAEVDRLRAELASRPTRAEVLREAETAARDVARAEGGMGTELDQAAQGGAARATAAICRMATTAERDDAGKDTREGESTHAASPAVGDRYDCRHGGEGVTVTRLWALDNGHPAVDFEYHDGGSSALPLDSFHRAYRPTERGER